MIHTIHSLRVRYVETDSMKYIYYGNYATYLEVARVELFRSLGISYSEIEDRGIWLPVLDFQIKYIKPGIYDEVLEIHTFIKEIPGAKIKFEYEIYNEKGEKISIASTTLFFLEAEKNKVIKCPKFLLELIEENWE
ncbi:acyl-CoA thioesterase [Frigoriflavimonas asaccharolytica]|uniref:Acyl-CoA thioester hydrolase n=1 Tax=Frigoriflavimonas asaccharolytica TaxID=2735899 RepID=A0A8J8K4K5_9FLAO|nr:thioesterase family protein [Frigoriflavimonas asaccharolytica]NRS91845.1 acyl-CoA thioester hydrolase [Frigoriflavimonas asaccharolytica]